MKTRWAVLGAAGIARRRTIPEGIMAADNAELAAVFDPAKLPTQDIVVPAEV